MEDFLKLCVIIMIVVGSTSLLLGIIFISSKAVDNSRLKDMKDGNNTTIIVNGSHVNVKDIISMSVNGAVVEIKTMNGQKIMSSNFTIITQDEPVKVEK